MSTRSMKTAILLASALYVFGGISSAHAQELVAPSSLVSGGNQLVVPLFKSRVLRLDAPATRVSVGNPDIADILILRATQLYVLGKDLGTTNVLLWDAEDRLIGTVNIEVGHDLENLKAKLFELLPNENIGVYSTQRSIVLTGEVSSLAAMNAALRIADTYLAQISTAVDSAQFEQQDQSRREDRAVGQVINLMQVGGVQQVMLEVKVAEINRTELREMNLQWNAVELDGQLTYGGVNGIGSDGLGTTFPDAEFESGLRVPVFPDRIAPLGPVIDEFAPAEMFIRNQGLFASFLSNDSLFNMALDIAKQNNLAKILAEPTLTTLTGQEASFLSGGEIAIPVPQTLNTITYEFKEFGVSVSFLPVVLGSGLINLKVDIAVSSITDLNLSGDSGSIPLRLATRRASSSVELMEGQTMGLAGLIDENMRGGVERFPGLGAIPVLGALFRSQAFENNETELVITVTPHLAKPIAPEDIRLPTDNFVEPNDVEFYMLGKLEGRSRASSRANAAAQSPAASAGGVEGSFGHQTN